MLSHLKKGYPFGKLLPRQPLLQRGPLCSSRVETLCLELGQRIYLKLCLSRGVQNEVELYNFCLSLFIAITFINLFNFWLCWVFVAVRRLSLVVVSGGYSSLRCTGFSLWWLLLLRSTGSRHTGFSSCGVQAQ